jgi:hypothetical protein
MCDAAAAGGRARRGRPRRRRACDEVWISPGSFAARGRRARRQACDKGWPVAACAAAGHTHQGYLKARQPGVASHRAAQVMGVKVQHVGPPSGVTSRGTVVVLMAVYGSPQLTSGWWKYLTCDAVTRLMSFRRAGSGAACAGANTQSARATAARTVEAHSLPLRRAPPSRRGEPAQNHSVRARRRAWDLGCHARGRARRPHVSPFARSMALRVTTRCDARRGSAPGTAQVQEGRDVCWRSDVSARP